MSCSVHGGLCDCEPPDEGGCKEGCCTDLVGGRTASETRYQATGEARVGSEARCPACEGNGKRLTWPYRLEDCPDCQGAGQERVRERPDLNAPNADWLDYHFPARPDEPGPQREAERVIPAADLRAFIAGEALDENDSWTAGWNSCREAVIAWLDEHTAKAPSGGER